MHNERVNLWSLWILRLRHETALHEDTRLKANESQKDEIEFQSSAQRGAKESKLKSRYIQLAGERNTKLPPRGSELYVSEELKLVQHGSTFESNFIKVVNPSYLVSWCRIFSKSSPVWWLGKLGEDTSQLVYRNFIIPPRSIRRLLTIPTGNKQEEA